MMLQKEGIKSADEMQNYFDLLEHVKERCLKKSTDPHPPPTKLICQPIHTMFCENYVACVALISVHFWLP